MTTKIFFSFLSVLLLSGALAGAIYDNPQKAYSILEKTFYLSADDAVWIRPGLHVQITDAYIPADRHPVVSFKLTDDKGQGLDKDGNFTPGTVSMGILLAYLPKEGSQYINYITRIETDSATGNTAVQATTDSGGKYVSFGDGSYTYTFKNVLPANYDSSATHTLGIYASRNLREYGLSRYVDNQVKNFVPSGAQPKAIREIVKTANCNQCHNPLMAHGETGRQNTEICILCHTPQTTDAETGNTLDFKVFIHKLHRGINLPTVKAGKPYQIVGFNKSVNDFSTVVFPQDIRNCTTCHKDTAQVNSWLLNPTRAACGSCHDDVNFATGANHAGGFQPNDNHCANCHWPEGEYEYDASISGAHIPEYKSAQLRNPKIKFLEITNVGQGLKPAVRFQITDKNGEIINPSKMAALRLTLGGPTSDYRWYVQESAINASVSQNDGSATYNFNTAIPPSATGTYAVESEGYVNTTLNPGTTKEIKNFRDAMDNVVELLLVTGKLEKRRAIVDQAKCLKCHDKLQLHGSNRNQIAACQICHNPTNTDIVRRPASELPAESVHFKILVHKIHSGENLANDFTVYGFGGSKNNFNDVRFPGDRRDCLQCHLAGTYTVPLPVTAIASTTPRNWWTPTLPTAAACLACHDSIEAAAHALINTASFGESCAVCHKESGDFGVSKVHAR